MRDIHFHVSSGAAFNNIFASAEYQDGYESVKDFLDMSFEIFGKDTKTTREQAENLLYQCIDRNERMSVIVGANAAMTLVWSACDCDFVTVCN